MPSATLSYGVHGESWHKCNYTVRSTGRCYWSPCVIDQAKVRGYWNVSESFDGSAVEDAIGLRPRKHVGDMWRATNSRYPGTVCRTRIPLSGRGENSSVFGQCYVYNTVRSFIGELEKAKACPLVYRRIGNGESATIFMAPSFTIETEKNTKVCGAIPWSSIPTAQYEEAIWRGGGWWRCSSMFASLVRFSDLTGGTVLVVSRSRARPCPVYTTTIDISLLLPLTVDTHTKRYSYDNAERKEKRNKTKTLENVCGTPDDDDDDTIIITILIYYTTRLRFVFRKHYVYTCATRIRT